MFTLSIVFGLLAALSWGSGDFIGGYLARRMSALFVVLMVDTVGIIVLAAAALLAAEGAPSGADLAYSAAAGVVGALGITIFYRGLALYRMGLMAPLTAVLTGLVPVLFGVYMEGLPGLVTFYGVGLALAAIWLISAGDGGPLEFSGQGSRWLLYSLAAGACFGLFFVFFDQVGDGSVYWPIVASRLTAIGLISILLAVRRVPVRRTFGSLTHGLMGVMMLGGLFDAAGNVFFVLAAQAGRLDISAVLASLFPAATVALAWLFLRERLARRQLLGVAAALAAVVLISL